MAVVQHSLLGRFRELRAFIAAWTKKLFGMELRAGDFASQRMCPFCGLITSRYESCCMECGRPIKVE